MQEQPNQNLAELGILLTSVFTFLGMIFNSILSYKREQRARQWAEEDRESAEENKRALESQIHRGIHMNANAITLANHMNDRIVAVAELANQNASELNAIKPKTGPIPANKAA